MISKFGSTAKVIEAKVAKQGGGFMKGAHKHAFDYDPRPGYLYVRSRAISSRINDNYDEFPAEEIRQSYRSFIGKPVFVNHHNENHRRARGIVVDAALHEDKIPKTGEIDTWVEVLMEVDAVSFPKLAQAIVAGEIDRTSMGCDVKASQCSACGNWAETPLQYCSHIPAQKGLKVRRKTASGEQEEVLVYEKCVGLSFFENSLLVEEPADPTAYFLGVDDRGMAMTASRKRSMRWMDRYEVEIWNEGGQAVSMYTYSVICDQHGEQVVGSPMFSTHDAAQRSADRLVEGHERMQHKAAKKAEFGNRGSCELCDVPATKTGYCNEHQNSPEAKADRAKKRANGETRVPGQVDTLRDDDCPVCGEHDSFDGDVCMVCQYKRPPQEFLDPDLEMAQEVNLRQEEEAIPGMDPDPETGQPNLTEGEEGLEPGLDENGMPIDGEDEEVLDEDELSAVEDEGDLGVEDPEQEALEEAVPEEMQPPEEGEDGLPEPEQAGEEDSEAEGLEESIDDEEGDIGEPEEAAEDAQEGELTGDDESDSPIDVNSDPESLEADPDADKDFSDEFAVQTGQTPMEGVDSEDDDSEEDDDDDFKKKKSHKSGDMNMRPTLEILAKQQADLNDIRGGLIAIAKAAGIERTPAIAKLVKRAQEGEENPAQGDGWANPDGYDSGGSAAPTDSSEETLGDVDNEEREGGTPDAPEVKGSEGDPNEGETPKSPGTSESKRRAQQRRRKRADLEDVEEIGETDEDDTEPDAKGDLEGGMTFLDEPLDLNEVDVTEPVAGTENIGEGDRGQAGSGRTETEVRVDQEQANNPEPAFDYDDGGWDKESRSEGRTITALRLARLRLEAGIEKGDDLELGTKLAKSSMSNQDMQAEINVLAKVVTANKVNQPARRPRGLVPRSASQVERTVPSFSAPQQKVSHAVNDDEFLFD